MQVILSQLHNTHLAWAFTSFLKGTCGGSGEKVFTQVHKFALKYLSGKAKKSKIKISATQVLKAFVFKRLAGLRNLKINLKPEIGLLMQDLLTAL